MSRFHRAMTWRRLVLLGGVLLLAVSLAPVAGAAQSPQVPLAPGAIRQFAQPLPVLALSGTTGTIGVGDGTQALTVRMCEFDAKVLPPGTLAPGVQPATRVWGYIVGNQCPSPTEVQDTYIGPVILASRDTPTEVTWVNELGTAADTGVLAYKYSTDQTLHWADPLNDGANACSLAGVPAFGTPCAENYDGPIAAVPHLHGGEVPPELDGGPDAWFTSDGAYQGHGYYSLGATGNQAVYRYPNTQEAGPLWFHDHTLGATRLNVYAGLAGGYLLADPDLTLPIGLASYGLDNAGTFRPTIPLVIQDRMFDTNGQLFFTADSAGNVLWALNPEHPYWNPEFIGDTILVNGKAWPFLNVEPNRYRFLFLNGSNARTYSMWLTDPVSGNLGPSLWVIGTDGGYLDQPVRINPSAGRGKLVMMPGERYEVIIDFSGYQAGVVGPNGQPYSGKWVLRNNARTPYPFGAPAKGNTTGRVMQFVVGPCAGTCPVDATYNPAAGGRIRTVPQGIRRLANPTTGSLAVVAQETRQLTLNEVMGMPQTATDPVTGVAAAYPGGPLEVLVNNTSWSGQHMGAVRTDFTAVTVGGATAYYSELPREGDTEVWEIVNLTADAHPIHLHLVQFQIINRQRFRPGAYQTAYDQVFPAVPGDPMCTGNVYCPGYGPPLDYNTGNPRALGGNPDITPFLQGPIRPPAPYEAGWKDTVIAEPGQVLRIAVRWAPTNLGTSAPAASLHYPFDPSGELAHGYVWHCHIIDHEDNEMMRPDLVLLNTSAPAPAARPLVKGTDY